MKHPMLRWGLIFILGLLGLVLLLLIILLGLLNNNKSSKKKTKIKKRIGERNNGQKEL